MLNWFKPRKPLSAIRLMIDKIDTTPLVTLNPYSSDKSLQTVITLFDTVGAYEKALIRHHQHLTEDTLIPRYTLGNGVKTIYLRDFFTQEGKFVDVPDAIDRFYKAARAFLEQYETQESLLDKSFNTEKNLLLLQGTVSNLLILLEGL